MAGSPLRLLIKSPLALSLIGLLVAIEVLCPFVFTDLTSFYTRFGLSREGISSFALWQLVSYSLLHGSWVHLLMNILLLVAVGLRLQWMVGRRTLWLVLLLGVLAGGAGHLLFSPDVVIGISGGMLALLLCHTTLSPESRWLMPVPISGKNLGRGLMLASLLLSLLTPGSGWPWLGDWGSSLARYGFAGVFEISHGCHLGGALAGWLCGRWMLRPRVSLASLQRDRARREGTSPERS